jgi:hypothetical protein
MSGLVVGQDLFMRSGADFQAVDLTGSRIGGDLDMSGSHFKGPLMMSGVEVGQNLLMQEDAEFREVDLTGVKIGGQVDMTGSSFQQEVTVRDAKVGTSLDLTGATLTALDLTGSVIGSTLRLGSAASAEATKWDGASRLVLRNTTVDAVEDAGAALACWPQELQMQGFAYRRLGNLGEEHSGRSFERKSRWFLSWLQRDRSISREPYEQLAQVLRTSGDPSAANDVLYAGRCRSRAEAWQRGEWMRWVGLCFLQVTIGYGLGTRYLRVLWWIAGLTLAGFLVLLASVGQSKSDAFLFAWASLDQALPIVHLDDSHWDFISEHCPRWAIAYFYIQKMLGGILSGCVGAGLAGLTQKN